MRTNHIVTLACTLATGLGCNGPTRSAESPPPARETTSRATVAPPDEGHPSRFSEPPSRLTGAGPQVSHSTLEQASPGASGTLTTVVVSDDGKVTIELRRWGKNGDMAEPATRSCRSLTAEESSQLRRLIDRAQAAVNSSSYSTSASPPPSANYSRSETYKFGAGQRWREITVGGWADQPEELRDVGVALNRLLESCP
jgi:hypothetical protein